MLKQHSLTLVNCARLLLRAAAKRANADLPVTWDKVMLSKAVVPTLTPTDAIDEMSTWT